MYLDPILFVWNRVCQSEQRWSMINAALQRNMSSLGPLTEESAMSYRTTSQYGTGIPASTLPHPVQLLRNVQRALDWVLSKQVEIEVVVFLPTRDIVS